MLIALLAMLGVDLIVLVVLAAFVFTRKRWVKRQPGAFRGATATGAGFATSSFGRRGRSCSGTSLYPPMGLTEQRPARPDEVKRLGEDPTVMRVRTDRATVEVGARGEDAELLLGPYRTTAAKVGAAATPTAAAASREQH
jgi:hypothetical protein